MDFLIMILWVVRIVLVIGIVILPMIGLITLGVFIWVWTDDFVHKYTFVEYIIRPILYFISVVVICSSLGYALHQLGVSANERAEYDYTTSERKLHAFEDNQGFYIRGGLFYTKGEDKLVYYYTVKTSTGFKSYRAEASDSEIRYTEKEPYLEYKKRRLVSPRRWHSFITRKLFPAEIMFGDGYNTYKYIFYVPEGSVKNEYNSDLK